MTRHFISTWHLWHAIKTAPPPHPAIRSTLMPQIARRRHVGLWVLGGAIAYYLLLSVLLQQAPGLVVPNLRVVTWAVILPLLGVSLGATAAIRGIAWITLLREGIRRSQHSAVADLIATTPRGKNEVLWTIAAIVFTEDRTIRSLPLPEAPFTRDAIRTASILAPLLLVFFPVLLVLLPALAILLGLYVDYVQACCVSLLAAAHFNRSPGSNVAGFAWLLLVMVISQFTAYGLAAAMVLWALLNLGIIPLFLLSWPALAAFYLVRELVIWGLWHWHDQRFYPEKLVKTDGTANTH